MIWLWLSWLACAPDPAEALVTKLSAHGELPTWEELSAEVPDLLPPLERVARNAETPPLARDRAWQILAASPDPKAAEVAAAGAADDTLPPATRLKLMTGLAASHPAIAVEVAEAHWCAHDSLVRRGARTAWDQLPAEVRKTRPRPRATCEGVQGRP